MLHPLPGTGPQDGEMGSEEEKQKSKQGEWERGVIGAHALCIISYSEEDSALSGNESGQRRTGGQRSEC